MRTCSYPGCGRPLSCKELCAAHYDQLRRLGRLQPIRLRLPSRMTAYERVMARTVADGDCLVFTGGRDRLGYGRIGVEGQRTALTHRVVAEHHYGPSALDVLHSCDNPPCVNPAHLRYGTVSDNMKEAMEHKRLSPRRFLSDEDVRAIRADPRSSVAIAAAYGITRPYIGRLKRRERRSTIE